ncbi:MAG: LytR C-terminal domain-containing protein, partial [Deltaproteobacteria bacterium]|nr:LytR C-terminal domain-containing protein [Deltaproteobacteria bacterium]MBW2141869.1 LytR C-terminal domain-containing protein [Deltaproteobacteria bacterium]
MTYKDDSEGQRPLKRLFSGIGLKLFLIIFLSAAALSFIILGLLRPEQTSNLAQKPNQNKISKPIILMPGQFEVKTAKTRTSVSVSQPGQPSALKDEVKPAPETKPLPVLKETGLTTTVSTSTTTTSIPTTTEPTITLAPGEAVKVTAKKFNLPPPKWQEMDKNWDKVKPVEAPKLDSSNLKGAGWKQLNLGQTERVRMGAEAETPSVAAVRAKTIKKPQKPAVKKTRIASSKKPVKPVARKAVSKPKPKTGPTLAIFNESGKAGMGQVYRDVLKEMGYPVTLVKDKPRKAGITTIYYKPGAKTRAYRLNDRIPEQK